MHDLDLKGWTESELASQAPFISPWLRVLSKPRESPFIYIDGITPLTFVSSAFNKLINCNTSHVSATAIAVFLHGSESEKLRGPGTL